MLLSNVPASQHYGDHSGLRECPAGHHAEMPVLRDCAGPRSSRSTQHSPNPLVDRLPTRLPVARTVPAPKEFAILATLEIRWDPTWVPTNTSTSTVGIDR